MTWKQGWSLLLSPWRPRFLLSSHTLWILLYYVIIYKLVTAGLSLVLDPATQRGLHPPGRESHVPSPTPRSACRLGWGAHSVLGPGSVKYLVWLPNDVTNTTCIIYPPALETDLGAQSHSAAVSAHTSLCAALTLFTGELVRVEGQEAFLPPGKIFHHVVRT